MASLSPLLVSDSLNYWNYTSATCQCGADAASLRSRVEFVGVPVPDVLPGLLL